MNNYKKRRDELCQGLDANSVIIVVGNTAKSRSKNIQYHFRPDNDLFYLTGFVEPNAVAVIRPMHSDCFTMFLRANDKSAEVSFGERVGLARVKDKFGVDLAFDIEEIDQQLPKLLEDRKNLYFLDEQGIYLSHIFNWANKQRRSTRFDVIKQYRNILSLQSHLHNKRRVKSEHEVEQIRQAVKASVSGHKLMMSMCSPGMNELQLSAIFDREIANFGCREVSYPSIVASGNNACCLHYEENNDELIDGNLVLIDAGAEYQFYCADITRTFPVNGKFSEPQKQIYQVVLNALDAAIAVVKPGACWSSIYYACEVELTKGLIDLGIISGSIDDAMEKGLHKEFSVHKTGHWLGLDVHDVGSYHNEDGNWVKLEQNMVFTIEPGLYFPENCQSVDAKWRGTGVRIEDDILVTSEGAENLSEAIPRTVNEIESIMKNSSVP